MTSSWTVIIPIKRFDTAKSRLGATGVDRESLARAFALDTLAACRETEAVRELIVVSTQRFSTPGSHAPASSGMDFSTSTSEASATESDGVRWVHDPGGGINAAVAAGHLAASSHSPTLALLADLPSIRSIEIELLLRLATEYPRSFLTDLAGTGSTALASMQGTDLDPRFGSRSRAAHTLSGAVELRHPDLVRARRDVDTAVDLMDAIRFGVGPHTQSVVGEL